MKRIGILSGLALAALALTNCSTKEIEVPAEVAAGKEGVPFEIIALAGDETRTTVNGMNTSWESTDEINLFHAVAGGTTYINDGVFTIADTETGQFTGTLAGSPTQGTAYDWYALYPYNASLSQINNKNGTNQSYTLGAEKIDDEWVYPEQSGLDDAHLGHLPMYGVKKNATYDGTAAPIIQMSQLASVAAVTITNSTSATINISSVSLTAPENIVGTYCFNILGENVVYTPSSNSSVSNTATLNVINAAIAKDDVGVFYLPIKPFTAASGSTISLTVNTSAGVSQTKEFNLTKDYTFTAGKMKTVKMNFTTEQDEEPASNDYILVENLSDISAGWYMIVNFDPANEDESYVLTNGHLTSDTQSATMLKDISGLTISADAKTITSSATNIKWKFEAVGNNEFKIKSAAPNSEDYLLCKNENTGLIIATWNYTSLQNTWNVSVNDGTNKYFYLSTEDSASDTRYLQVYLSKPDWRTYKGANQAYNLIRLYKKGTLLPLSGIGFSTASYEFTLDDANYTAFTGQALTNPNNVSVTWSSSNTQLASVSNGTVTFVPNKTGTTTISATFAGNQSFRSETVSYTITVNQNDAGLSLPFTETFANAERTSTFNGGTGDLVCDNDGWEISNGAPFNGSAKFGTGSAKGIATTPALNYSGNATLTFDAAAWNQDTENKFLDLAVSSGHIYSDASLVNEITQVTLAQANWTTFTVYLKDVETPFTVTFSAHIASKNRFFLDNISIVEGIDSSTETVADPSFNPAAGTYTTAQNVSISCNTPGASIYYTTDGSTPTASSTLYSSPISVSETMTIKAIAIKDGTSSNVVTAAYTINLPTVDYVTLDWSFPGGSSADLTAIAGVTASGLGSDYAAGNAPYLIKFDTTGDYIMVKTDDSIGDVSVDYKMIGGSATSSITFSESSDGESWNDVQTLSISGAQNDTGTLKTTSSFNSASRYVKMTFTKGSNVGIGGIRIRHTAVNSDPTDVTFTAGQDTGDSSVTKDGITVSMSTMNRTDNYRTYADTDMTVSAETGKTIKKIVVTCTGSGTNNNGPGKFSGTGYSYSGTIGTWEGSASNVTLSASAQVRMTKIVVTYQ
jgi:hypothetical protein